MIILISGAVETHDNSNFMHNAETGNLTIPSYNAGKFGFINQVLPQQLSLPEQNSFNIYRIRFNNYQNLKAQMGNWIVGGQFEYRVIKMEHIKFHFKVNTICWNNLCGYSWGFHVHS